MSTLTLQIPDELNQQLEAISRQQQRPAGELVQESLRRYLAQEELRLLRDKLRPYSDTSGYHSDEDVFKAVS
jgi:hypothetical protein